MNNKFIDAVLDLFLKLLGVMPASFYRLAGRLGGHFLDRQKGDVARAAIQLTLNETRKPVLNDLARRSARFSMDYLLALPRLKQVKYLLHGQDLVEKALSQNKGAVIVSLHMGPPDLATMALTELGLPACTLIGRGKGSPITNSIGRKILDRAGIDFIQRGDPTAVLNAVKQKRLVFLYCDMRSKELPVTFFGQKTTAPASGVMIAQLLKVPVLFHYCTYVDNEWQLHFESFDMEEGDGVKAGGNKEGIKHNIQRLIYRMEEVIRESPELWIWHYDRFNLKKH